MGSFGQSKCIPNAIQRGKSYRQMSGMRSIKANSREVANVSRGTANAAGSNRPTLTTPPADVTMHAAVSRDAAAI